MALINADRLVLGNGDLFLDPNDILANLPSVSSYKTAYTNGTLPSMAGYTGAMKGTATIQIQREPANFETGVPQEIADQTVIREGCVFKCSLAEITLKDVFTQIGGGIYSNNTSGSTLVTNELFNAGTPAAGNSYKLLFGPLLDGTTTPSAAAPVVQSAGGATTYVLNTDYEYDLATGEIWIINGTTITAGEALQVTYHYNQSANQTLTMGGQASLNSAALRFFHPFKWGGVLALTIYKANPAGTLAIPFEEIAYSFRELEFRAIAVSTNAQGNHLLQLYLDSYPGETGI